MLALYVGLAVTKMAAAGLLWTLYSILTEGMTDDADAVHVGGAGRGRPG